MEEKKRLRERERKMAILHEPLAMSMLSLRHLCMFLPHWTVPFSTSLEGAAAATSTVWTPISAIHRKTGWFWSSAYSINFDISDLCFFVSFFSFLFYLFLYFCYLSFHRTFLPKIQASTFSKFTFEVLFPSPSMNCSRTLMNLTKKSGPFFTRIQTRI